MKSQELYDAHSATVVSRDIVAPPAARNVRIADWVRGRVRSGSGIVRIIELGFGDGELSRVLAQAGPHARVVGYDISPARAERAAAEAASLGLTDQLEYRVADLDEELASIEPQSADLIVAIDVMEHVFDVFGFVAKLGRIVKPGGAVLLRVPNIAYIKHRFTLVRGRLPVTSSWFGSPGDLSAWRSTWGWDGGHLHFFTTGTLGSLLEGAGFKPVRWGDPGASMESLRARLPGLLCGNLCVLAERTK